jgi:hypothetical protein
LSLYWPNYPGPLWYFTCSCTTGTSTNLVVDHLKCLPSLLILGAYAKWIAASSLVVSVSPSIYRHGTITTMSWVIPDAISPFWSHADSARSVKRRGNKDFYIWTHPGPKWWQNNEYYECRSRNKHEMISLFLLKATGDLGVTNLRELTLPDHTLHPGSTVHRDMFIV